MSMSNVLEFKRPQPPPPQIPRCVCDHTQDVHLAGSGACRPGFVCLSRCELFREKR